MRGPGRRLTRACIRHSPTGRGRQNRVTSWCRQGASRAGVLKLGAEISERFSDLEQPLVLVVVLKGGIVFAADLMRSLTIPVEVEFVRAASYGNGTASAGQVAFSHLVEAPLAGRETSWWWRTSSTPAGPWS